MLFHEKIKNKIPLISILLLFTCVFLLFGHYKEYLYEDEVLSYTAANCQDGMRPQLPVNRIVNGEEFVINAVAVRPDSRFDFANTIANTSKDPHPPVYLLMLHLVSSLSPGVFSKWFALLINFIFGAVTVILLYLLGDRVFKEKRGRFISVIYVLSIGFITQLMNLRMYVVLQAFTTWLTLQYISIIREKEEKPEIRSFNKKRILLLIVNVILGTMTHYYFLIFAFFEAAVFSIMLIKKRQFRELIKHTLIYVASGLATLVIFPPIIWQLTGSDVGSESFGTRDLPELIRRFRVMMSHLNNEMYGGQLKLYVLCFAAWAVCGIFAYTRGRERKYSSSSREKIYDGMGAGFALVFLTAVLYFLTVSVTTPYLTGRYLSPVYPLFVVVTVGVFRPLILKIFRSETFGYFVLTVVMAIPLYLWVSGGLYDVNKAAMQEISKEHSGEICIFFRGISTEENYFELENYDRVMAMRLIPREDEEEGDTALLAKEKSVVVYVPSDKDPEDCFNRIREYDPELTKSEKLYNAYYSNVYRLY